jgi:di/tricarboxylate transporter
MKKPSWLNLKTLLILVILYGILAVSMLFFIYMYYVAITDDDIVYNIIGWSLIIIVGGIAVLIPALKFNVWLKKKKQD